MWASQARIAHIAAIFLWFLCAGSAFCQTLILTGFTVSGRRFGLSLAGMAAGVAFRVSLRKRENMQILEKFLDGKGVV